MKKQQQWPADRPERRKVADLVPYARNARTHSDEQVAQIAASIREWGWTTPVLIDEDGGIIAGHGRVMAAKKLGLSEIPVLIASGWSEAQKRAYVLADNKLALNAGWDNDLLKIELGELQALDFDVQLTGFSLDEVGELFADGEHVAEDSGAPSGAGSLSERFGIPPFSVLNAREGWWQDRKRAWLALGIQSELGRGEQLIPNGGGNASKARYDAGGVRSER
jgi:ParB-like chromosome segregation protein Spo0J